ncbi:hypothetical protein AOLI_G00302120 [Acnodon oligacanthus]
MLLKDFIKTELNQLLDTFLSPLSLCRSRLGQASPTTVNLAVSLKFIYCDTGTQESEYGLPLQILRKRWRLAAGFPQREVAWFDAIAAWCCEGLREAEVLDEVCLSGWCCMCRDYRSSRVELDLWWRGMVSRTRAERVCLRFVWENLFSSSGQTFLISPL